MLVIYSKLAIAPPDRTWIDEVRRAHDPQRDLVEPHVTFVFPFTGAGGEGVLQHVRAVAAAAPPIPFRLSRAAAVKDAFSSAVHLFLLPAEADAFHALHARLYGGLLAVHRHPTAPYLPHVTVGAFAKAAEAERVAAGLGPVAIEGRLESLILGELEAGKLTELHEVRLGPTDPAVEVERSGRRH